MKTNLNNRLEKLEALKALAGGVVDIPLGDLLASIETAEHLPAGSLPRSTEEAAALGFDSIAAATAAALGLSMRELKEALCQTN